MERCRTSSQTSVHRRRNASKNSSAALINEIDDLIQHGILDSVVEYDPKLDFICAPIVTHDQGLKQIRRQTCGLIWKSIRSPSISKSVQYDHSCAFVEILQVPKKWSRYDTDLLLLKIGQKHFLNGLALRDEFIRVLQLILQRDFNQNINTKKQYPYELKHLDFTRNTIQLVLNIEFDIPCTDFFPDTYTSLCYHSDLNEYLNHHPDIKLTRLTPYNSIKFRFDYSLTEAKLCEYLLEKSTRLSLMLTNFLNLRKQWSKYIRRAARYVTETSRMQAHSDKSRSSVCSINSIQSSTSNTSEFIQNSGSLSTEIEEVFEFIFSIPLLRLLFVTICSKYKQLGSEHDNDTVYVIEKALQLFTDALENNYLEHPFLHNVNILPDSLLSQEISIKIGIEKLVKEMQRDWKRRLHR